MTRDKRLAILQKSLRERILVLDGGMGSMIQGYGLEEADYRGCVLTDHSVNVKGNNELISLTQPDILREIHLAYYKAGADFAETNTFGANAPAQGDYGLEHLVYDMNVASARIAREAADRAQDEDGRVRFVIGTLGPTPRTASLSPDVNDPGFRNITFDQLEEAYGEAARGLIEGGVDLLMIETVFDTLNAKAALFAVQRVSAQTGTRLPVMVSGTITDASGRILSGQTVEAFWYSIRHVDLFSVGLNCALGAKQLRPYIDELSRIADTAVSAHPNAGLPNAFGEYDQSPEEMAALIEEYAQSGLVNIVGGCCGSTPVHIRALADAVCNVAPRTVPVVEKRLRLSGLEPFVHV